MLYTSYFSKLAELERNNICPVAICAKMPDWCHIPQYKKLAPSYDILMQYKKINDSVLYRARYKSEILYYLQQEQVIYEIRRLVTGEDIALLCYESPYKFCHRQLVAEWLNDAGIPCIEYEVIRG